jgi:putative ABC transport system permease protein
MMGTLLQDLRYGWRMLLKSPGFSAVAVLTLALGIGANTAIFSVVNAVLLRPLPFPQSQQLVSLQYFDSARKLPYRSASIPDFLDWRSQNQVFSGVAAFNDDSYTLTGTNEPQHLSAGVVSAGFFSTLGIVPQLGRGFLPEEEKKGERVVILSDRLWRTLFSADPKIVGRGITLSNRSYTVVGVAPAGFDFPIVTPPVQIWTTIADYSDMSAQRGAHFLRVVGRMKPGVTLAQAQADLARINGNLSKAYPGSNLHFDGALVVPELQYLVGDAGPALLILFGAVGCVLLIACANVANLLLARSMTRQREMAVRAALGAGRGRVVRQLLTESLLLALVGGGLGFVFALWGTQGLLRLVPQDIPRMAQIKMDSHVFFFTLLAALVTGILFGLAPALQSANRNLFESLKESSGGAGLSGGLPHNRLRAALVVAEMALALTLLMGAGLMLQSFARLQNVNPGFNPHNVLTFTFDMPSSRYKTEQQKVFYRQLLDRLSALPGVVSASGATPLPLSGDHMGISFTIEGQPVAKGNEPDEEVRIVAPGYFKTMGIPLLEGREFAPTDTSTSPDVVVVNQAFARKYFPNEDPVGKRMKPDVSDSDAPGTPVREIVGVVGSVKTRSLSQEAKPEYFLPYQQALITTLSMVLRTQAAPESEVGAARETVRSMDASLPLYGVESMDQYVGASVAQPRFSMLLLAIFAGLALALTAVGIYGVMAYAVSQRTHEIGIRLALGAQQGDVMRLVLGYGVKLALAGVAVGIAAALALTRLLSSALYAVSPHDPLTFVAVALALMLVALAACYIPARRAMRVDPMIALRYE